jgi:hypothetical protein
MALRTLQVTPAQAALLQDRVSAAQAATTAATDVLHMLALGHVAFPISLEAIDAAAGILTIDDPTTEAHSDG